MEINKLIPVCKQYIWGGNKLAAKYNKDNSFDSIAETWELSAHADGICGIDNGKLITEILNSQTLGTNCTNNDLPILIKLIDSKDNLSIQVHPDDNYAASHNGGYGKNEMWYIVEADTDAFIYLGFKENVTQAVVRKAIADGNLTDYLNQISVKAGEHYYIPSGTIHAIGAGCVICEVQQSSNLTYRVYDYGRLDSNGNARQLHIEDGLAVMNMSKYVPHSSNSMLANGLIIDCPYFNVHKHEVINQLTLHVDSTSFMCVICVGGSGTIEGKTILTGDSCFIPASYGDLKVDGNTTIICVTL